MHRRDLLLASVAIAAGAALAGPGLPAAAAQQSNSLGG